MMLFVVVDGVQVEPMVRRETRPEHKVIQPPPQGYSHDAAMSFILG